MPRKRAGSKYCQGAVAAHVAGRTALHQAVAVAALVLGTSIYLIDRAPGHAMLIPHLGSAGATPMFGAMGAWLPSFLHPLAFALLTAAVLPAASPWRYGGCALWGAINVLFEMGQHAALKGAWLVAVDIGAMPSALARYFIRGTFDTADLAAAAAGALAAAALLRGLDRLKENDHAK